MKLVSTLFLVLLIAFELEAQERKTIVAFDLYHFKSTLDDDTKAQIKKYTWSELMTKANKCVKIPNEEARAKMASDTGMFVNWEQNQKGAARIASEFEVDGYITMSLMNEGDKTRVSVVFHENGKPLNYWSEIVDSNLDAIMTTMVAHVAKICETVGK